MFGSQYTGFVGRLSLDATAGLLICRWLYLQSKTDKIALRSHVFVDLRRISHRCLNGLELQSHHLFNYAQHCFGGLNIQLGIKFSGDTAANDWQDGKR